MGIFTRMRDIVSSNINAMLDRAEDPEKLIRLMIQEMEDTLVEIKASCAGAMAEGSKLQRRLDQVRAHAREWERKARLAVDKGREDLAREALLEKRRHAQQAEQLQVQRAETEAVVDQYQDDIMQLETKLDQVREKQRVLIQRHIHARQQMRAQQDIRRAGAAEVMMRFEKFQQRVERMEAEAELVNPGFKSTLDSELGALESDDEIERELQALKGGRKQDSSQEPPA